MPSVPPNSTRPLRWSTYTKTVVASSTGRVSSQIAPATSIDHENIGARSSVIPGERRPTTVETTQIVAMSNATITPPNATRYRSTPSPSLPNGPPLIAYAPSRTPDDTNHSQ